MAHDFVGPPIGGSYLTPTEAVNRMVHAFGVHEIDRAKGQALADQMIAKLEQLDAPAELLEDYRAERQGAVSCYLSDDGSDDSYLSFTLWPDKPIFIGYHSARHEQSSRLLLDRLAAVLGYEISR
jgi:hypothetical protein